MPSRRPRLLPAALAAGAALLVTLALRSAVSTPARVDEPLRPLADPAPGAPARVQPRLAARAPWGGGPGALGRELPAEGAPLGPMSFAVDAQGAVHALDTVNGRVVVLGQAGAPRAVPLPSLTIDDLELLDDGGYVALDRHTSQSLHFLDREGRETGRVALRGDGLPEPGLATALFVRADGVWVEVEHQRLVRVATREGQAVVDRGTVPGRFLSDHRGTASAARQGASLRLTTRTPSLRERLLAAPTFALPVALITGLEARPGGGLVAGVELRQDRPEAPYDTLKVQPMLLEVDGEGVERWRAEVPPDEGPEENFRPVRLGRDGAVYAMVFRREGVEFWQVRP